MQNQFGTAAMRRLAGVSLFVFALASPALALDTALDNVTYETVENGVPGTVTIKRVEATGLSLTQDEFAKIFAKGTPEADRKAIIAKMKASKISIPEMVAVKKDGKVSVTGFVAENIDQGKVGHAAIGTINGDVPGDDGGRVMIKSGAMAIDGANLSGLLAADPAGGKFAFTHLSLTGLELNAPDKDTPASAPGGNMFKFTLDSFVADATADGDVPLKGSGKLNSLTIVPPPSSAGAQGLAAVGISKLDLGVTFSGTYDPAAKTYTIDDYTMTGANIGTLGLKTQLANIEKAAFIGGKDEKMGALMQGALANVELKFTNAGIVEKGIALYAAQQGKTPDAVKQEWTAMANQFVPIVLGGDTNSLKVAAAVASFVADPKAITISAKSKGAPLPFMELAATKDPMSLVQKVEINAVSASAGAAPAPATPTQLAPTAKPPAAAPQPMASAAPPAGQALTGIAAWNALVGNSVIGKNDDGDTVIEYYLKNGTVRQLAADEASAGKWTLKGEKVCMKYPDDDEACYKITVKGKSATFVDEDDSETVYEILPGNAKNLQ